MDPYSQAQEILYAAIAQVNETLEPGRELEKSPDTVVAGESARLDSLGFVSFVIAVEESAERLVGGQPFSLLDTVMSEQSKRWTVAALADRMAEHLQDRAA